jgi:hypothetical protein
VVGWFPGEAFARTAARAYDGPGKVFAAKVIHGAPRPQPAASGKTGVMRRQGP